MPAQSVRDAIAALDQEIEALQYIIDRMPHDKVLHGENWREILIQERAQRIESRTAWKERLELRKEASTAG